jgi:hypothetical protein
MEFFVGYELCECPVHQTVCAKHFRVAEAGGGFDHSYECPGVPGDTGRCNQTLNALGQACNRPEWAQYPSERE